MGAYVKQLYDGEGVPVYPPTKASAVYMQGGKVTAQTVLNDLKEAGQRTEFLENGNIKVTHPSGNITTTEFLQSGTIKETTTDPEGNEVCIKTTSFGSDGSITTNVTYEGEEQEES